MNLTHWPTGRRAACPFDPCACTNRLCARRAADDRALLIDLALARHFDEWTRAAETEPIFA